MSSRFINSPPNVSQLLNRDINELREVRNRGSTDIEAPNLGNVRSGVRMDEHLSTNF